jgi:hypothetical protein
VAAGEPDVAGHQGRAERGQQGDVEGKKARDGEVAVVVATLREALDGVPEDRGASGDPHLYFVGPVPPLIPAQDKAGDGEAEHEQEQADAGEPGHLARAAVGADPRGLGEVEAADDHQRGGAVKVEPANKPTERHLVFDVGHRSPGVRGRWTIEERQRQAGEAREAKQERGDRAQGVRERRAARRDPRRGGGRESFVEPGAGSLDDLHGYAGSRLLPPIR